MADSWTQDSLGRKRWVFVALALAFWLAPALRGQEAATSPAESLESSAAAKAEEDDKGEPFQRPAFKVRRQDEDWSGLRDRDPSEPGDPYDFLKYVRLPVPEDIKGYLSFGGQVRSRIESWQNFGFGGPGDRSDSFWLNRVRAHADLHLTDYFRGFIEGKSAFSGDRDLPGGRRTLDVDELDLQNGFVEGIAPLGDASKVSVRAGRQELLLGKQRLVSPLDWSNTRRTFDGFTAEAKISRVTATALYTQPVVVRKFEFNKPDSQSDFWGVYSTTDLRELDAEVDLYYLALNRDTSAAGSVNGTLGREDRYTVGGRVGGVVANTYLDYDIEGAFQFGRQGGSDINAYMVTTEVGYNFPEFYWTPRVWGGVGSASGDNNPGGSVNTFNQLFPLGHLYMGFIDTIGRQNVVDVRTGVSAKPTAKVTLRADWHYFWREDTDDGLYNAGGALVRPGSAGNSADIGSEVDLTAKYAINRHLLAVVGYSHFFPGRFIEQSGRSQDIDFGYLTLQYTF